MQIGYGILHSYSVKKDGAQGSVLGLQDIDELTNLDMDVSGVEMW